MPFIGILTGFGFALMGMWFSAIVPSMDSFTYVQSALLTPLLMLSGVYFPITSFPTWVQTLAQVNPLFHSVNLIRDAVFGWQWPQAFYDVGVLAVFAALMAMLAIRSLRRRLID